jgi:ATP-dependent DNA helicase RecG
LLKGDASVAKLLQSVPLHYETRVSDLAHLPRFEGRRVRLTARVVHVRPAGPAIDVALQQGFRRVVVTLRGNPAGVLRVFQKDLVVTITGRVRDGRLVSVMRAFEGPEAGWPIIPRYASDRDEDDALRRGIIAALTVAPDLPQDAPQALRDAIQGLRTTHQPTTAEMGLDGLACLARLELECRLLPAALARAAQRRPPRIGNGQLVTRLADALPFTLGPDQQAAVEDIRRDLASNLPMRRLVQGDVGTGKTVVALMAMALVVETGAQGTMLAPTEILAGQHFERLRPFAEAAGLRLGLLTGRDKGAARRQTLAALAAGDIDIVFGTHALLQDEVRFRSLGLAVIDEQHRFGVVQRAALARKGAKVDVLLMSATPSPRTMSALGIGAASTTRLGRLPGREPIDTRALPLTRLTEVVEGIGRALATGARVFWVCPLVEGSEDLDVAAATDRHEALRQVFGERVGLIHGKMPGRDKDAAMAAFAAGETDILVATTLIEVGVDVPHATIMVIEHAERYGFAQLHQLRGRVGRGSGRSTCLLMYDPEIGYAARERIETLRRTDDGLEIAEADRRLRGEGDVFGIRQSGETGMVFADPARDATFVEQVNAESRRLAEERPAETRRRAEALKVLAALLWEKPPRRGKPKRRIGHDARDDDLLPLHRSDAGLPRHSGQ